MKIIKENIRLIIAVFIALILIVTGLIILNDLENENNMDQPVIQVLDREAQLEQLTGMSSSEAIDIIKEIFGRDNYEFDCIATNDSLYKVTIDNKIDNEVISYYVDPVDGSYYMDMETK